MELNELKSLWKEDYIKLQDSLELNRKLLSKTNKANSISEYERFRNISVLGRNMALVYATISFIWAIMVFPIFLYSIPLLLGGVAMVWSFTQHLAIERKTNFHELPIIELQRRIQRFRIHTSKHKIYDGGIILFWFVTIAPIYLKSIMSFDIYESLSNFGTFAGVVVAIVVVSNLLMNGMYRKIDSKLNVAEDALAEIDMFEGFSG